MDETNQGQIPTPTPPPPAANPPEFQGQAQPLAKKTSPVLWAVVIGVALLLGMGFMAMRFLPGLVLSGMTGGQVRQNFDGSMTVNGQDGRITSLGASAKLPAGWPTDVPPPYNGAEVSVSVPGDDYQGDYVIFRINRGTEDQATEYYKSGFQSMGWALESDYGGNLVFSKGNKRMAVSAVDYGDGTIAITMLYGVAQQ